jgi:xanthine dehydrogenase accessory factor
MAVRRTVSFSEAVYEGEARVEEALGRLAPSVDAMRQAWSEDWIPVLIDPDASSLPKLRPDAVVDAIMAKRNSGTSREMAPVVVGLGPGFVAGRDVHAVVETNRGPHLGRVYWEGQAEADTGEPGAVGGETARRLLRAPLSGTFRGAVSIGDVVNEGDLVGTVEKEQIRAALTGTVRGLLRHGATVQRGIKVGDIDPRLDPELCRQVSDKSLAVAGGALEAILTGLAGRGQ